jgi:hypothetical protein
MDFLHSSHWVIYALLLWPVVSLAVTPFLGRFFNSSNQHNGGPYGMAEEPPKVKELKELAELPFSFPQPKV